jgi:hypothetical protein
MRITVYDVLWWLMTEEQIVEDYPELSKDDIRACLAFAADRERHLATFRSAGAACFGRWTGGHLSVGVLRGGIAFSAVRTDRSPQRL